MRPIATAYFLPLVAHAWWDEGHMLIGGIAERFLSEVEKGKINSILQQWDDQYPGMSTIAMAAPWADHIKCVAKSKFCSGLSHFDSFEAFNAWHYIALPYNPQNLTLDATHEAAPFQLSGTPWALSMLTTSLTGRTPNIPVPGLPVADSETLAGHHHHGHRRGFGSVLGLNLSLRLLIHLVGDLHQPLHNSEAIYHQNPKGDHGGTKVRVDYECVPPELSRWGHYCNLHSIWDTAGGLYDGLWWDSDPETIEDEVSELVGFFSDYEEKTVADDPFDFFAMAYETHRLALANVYAEFDFTDDTDRNVATPYCPSNHYIENARRVGRKQLYVAGHRLARLLSNVAKTIAPVEELVGVPLSAVVSRRQEDENLHFYRRVSIAFGSLAAMSAVAAMFFAHKARRNHNQYLAVLL